MTPDLVVLSLALADVALVALSLALAAGALAGVNPFGFALLPRYSGLAAAATVVPRRSGGALPLLRGWCSRSRRSRPEEPVR